MVGRFATALSLVFVAACAGTEDDDTTVVPPRDAGVETRDGGVIERDGGVVDRDGGTIDPGVVPIGFAETAAIFDVRCAPCHEVGNRDRRIIVTDYDRIVDRPSPATQMPYVTPSDPDNSWIFRKITNTHVAVCRDVSVPTRNCGGVMPTRDGTALTPAQVETVRAWIAGGALR